MTHTYNITGMTCSGCQAKVETLLKQVAGVTKVDISLAEGTADITMQNHVATAALKEALAAYPKYQLEEARSHQHISMDMAADEERTWLQTYKPILLIFAYIITISTIAAVNSLLPVNTFMRVFMGAFFLVFSFFKLLDIRGFADSYAMYDIVAKRWRGWAYLYVFIELGLGLAYVLNFMPALTNFVTLVVMVVSITGVLQSVFNKQKIRCACLGAVFNLPMSTVTIIEDGLMIAMSAMVLLF